MNGLLIASAGILGLVAGGESSSMINWLLDDGFVSRELTMTRELATLMDRNKLEGLAASAAGGSEGKGGLVLVLPTNEAWLENSSLYDFLIKKENKKFRNDLLLSAGGEISEIGDFETLLGFASKNDGVVDTAYGSPMKIYSDGTACLGEYDDNWNLITSDCTALRLPPIIFNDGSLYLTDKIIIPEPLKSEIQSQM